jgi:hypothetical protein
LINTNINTRAQNARDSLYTIRSSHCSRNAINKKINKHSCPRDQDPRSILPSLRTEHSEDSQ